LILIELISFHFKIEGAILQTYLVGVRVNRTKYRTRFNIGLDFHQAYLLSFIF
jgi:hypothetical protein